MYDGRCWSHIETLWIRAVLVLFAGAGAGSGSAGDVVMAAFCKYVDKVLGRTEHRA